MIHLDRAQRTNENNQQISHQVVNDMADNWRTCNITFSKKSGSKFAAGGISAQLTNNFSP